MDMCFHNICDGIHDSNYNLMIQLKKRKPIVDWLNEWMKKKKKTVGARIQCWRHITARSWHITVWLPVKICLKNAKKYIVKNILNPTLIIAWQLMCSRKCLAAKAIWTFVWVERTCQKSKFHKILLIYSFHLDSFALKYQKLLSILFRVIMSVYIYEFDTINGNLYGFSSSW